ncbi:unnamed protein product [Cuscuta europaea]|uniref:Bifunctional inhibitor/plant lipid transfer protein/seed storage helical domain-containing protein n=1 Tax=Cuscuta europaea TaxID=41803 RepID=A0A9P0YNS1_CUSEU|nr:unnamed protein product [Cuscuta europaea]
MAAIAVTRRIAVLLLVVVGLAVTDAQAPAGAPAAPEDCMTELLGMSDCLTYVEAGSNLTKPDKGCCPELKDIVNNHPVCLCKLLADPNNNSVGIAIEVKKALNLPTACKIDSLSPSLCSVLGINVGVPAPSPAEGPSSGKAHAADAGSPSSATGGSGGLASSPSAGKGASAAPKTTFFHLCHSLLALAFTLSFAYFL